jgi:hypothetical protein
LGFAEYMLNTFAESAKFYWRAWGPLGEPMIRATDEWVDIQRRYLRSLRETSQPGEEPQAGTAAPESRADAEELPIEDYDSLDVNQITQRLGGLSDEEIARLRDYEARNKNRRSIMQRLDARSEAGSS